MIRGKAEKLIFAAAVICAFIFIVSFLYLVLTPRIEMRGAQLAEVSTVCAHDKLDALLGIESEDRDESDLLNINTASEDELETLPGISPALAKNIVYYRRYNGIFTSIDDIMNVTGMGTKKFSNIKDLITVSGGINIRH